MDGYLRNIRKQKRLSQSALAEKAGVHRTTVSRLERRAGPPNWRTLEELAKVLGVPTEAIIAGAEAVTGPSITPLPAIPRMRLGDFLEQLTTFFAESGIEDDRLPMEKWVQRCTWAMQKMLDLDR